MTEAIADGRGGWVGMTKAKDLAQLLWDQAGDISANLTNYSQPQVYDQLRRLVGLNGYRDSEVLATRNTFPEGNSTRRSQDETVICSRYEPGINRSKEFRDAAGILHLSNEAELAVVFRISEDQLNFSDLDVPVLEVKLGDKYLYMRIADLWSQPGVLGAVPVGIDIFGPGWGSIVGPFCDLSQSEQEQAEAEQGGGQVFQSPPEAPQSTPEFFETPDIPEETPIPTPSKGNPAEHQLDENGQPKPAIEAPPEGGENSEESNEEMDDKLTDY
ncbi:MAG: hypothetical protein Q7S31_01505 [bacterium]|nr:hypothetical protein [bacterium]